jgi:hypothetical protein
LILRRNKLHGKRKNKYAKNNFCKHILLTPNQPPPLAYQELSAGLTIQIPQT